MTIEEKFADWLLKIHQSEKIDQTIIAFNFGLFESTESYQMYLIGSKLYDPNDEDWATLEDFIPRYKYFDLGKEISVEKKWQDILGLSIRIISDYVNSDEFQNSILKNANAITTGFDGGNLSVIFSKY